MNIERKTFAAPLPDAVPTNGAATSERSPWDELVRVVPAEWFATAPPPRAAPLFGFASQIAIHLRSLLRICARKIAGRI